MLDELLPDSLLTPAADILTLGFVLHEVQQRVKKLNMVLARERSIHFSWETVLFSVMGYYNH